MASCLNEIHYIRLGLSDCLVDVYCRCFVRNSIANTDGESIVQKPVVHNTLYTAEKVTTNNRPALPKDDVN